MCVNLSCPSFCHQYEICHTLYCLVTDRVHPQLIRSLLPSGSDNVSVPAAQPVVRPSGRAGGQPEMMEAMRRLVEQNRCTYLATGTQFAPQPYYMCFDCGIVDGQVLFPFMCVGFAQSSLRSFQSCCFVMLPSY